MYHLVKTCACIGHSDSYNYQFRSLYCAVENALLLGCEEFMCGIIGAFDWQFAKAVRIAKTNHPEKTIKLTLVLPYYFEWFENKREEYEKRFDAIICPEELKLLPPRKAVKKRNRWIVEHSDMLICYAEHRFCGEYRTIQYAKKAEKYVLNVFYPELDLVNRFILQRMEGKSFEEVQKDLIYLLLDKIEQKRIRRRMKHLHPCEVALQEDSAKRIWKKLNEEWERAAENDSRQQEL